MGKEQLTRRQHYLDLLDKSTNSFKKGTASHIALLGPKNCGKTAIVKEHLKSAKDVVCIYCDLSRMSLNPENFSVEFAGNVLWHFLKKPISEFEKFFEIGNILNEKSKISQNAFLKLKEIENELLKIKPDQQLIVKLAFDFAQTLGSESGKKFVIALDNFECLLDLNNFSAVKDVISLIDFEGKNVNYIAASSMIRQSVAILKDFECYEIKNLGKEEAISFCQGIIGKNEKAAAEIFELVQGDVLATQIVSRRFLETKNVKKAFAIELLVKNNPLHSYCSDSFNYYYSMARGQTLLRSVLKAISQKELRLTDIAKKIYRSAPVAKSVIERLIEADAVFKKDGKFYISNSVLSAWIRMTASGYELDSYDEEIILEAMKAL